MRFSVLIFLLVAGSFSADALGRDGHRLVCAMAYEFLTPKAKQAVDDLMALDSDYGAFADSCSWADVVRGTTHRYTAPYHYTGLAPNDTIVDSSDCAPGGCIMRAILEHGAILRQPDQYGEDERLEALKFLGHWLGDIHTPLHVSINGDRGGNDLKTQWLGERDSNLHRAWDSELILTYMAEKYGIWPAKDRWQPLLRELLWDAALDGVEVREPLDPVRWAQESHDIARSWDMAYRFSNKDTVVQPGMAYYQRNLPVILRRIRQGGIRLAGVLNTIFDPVTPIP